MYSSKELELLELLEEKGYLETKMLADLLALDEETIESMLEKFKQDGILLGFRAMVNWQKINRHDVTAFIDVKVAPKRGRGFDDVAERIYRFPEVTALYLMSGAYDLQVVIQASSLQDVASFVSDKLSPLDSVLSTTTHFKLKTYKHDGILFTPQTEDKRLNITP
ncbi:MULTISPECIES: Lrp/AsnC family transcriptional regulator [Exiguobacterium]|jgi:DNA-binding Lrp family transcriptional regulator|uniref:Lrp/AsnC family transcriptional regulator n=1 Tax=Exiguobacterium TaxID=33986 RepID=UPI00093DB013|nr:MULTISPECIES: Lrp/AsnC family transcriptional regulator [Exiguobacterium]MCA0980809.1 Lrp/AsnC family transcriptional regulator [Exiguobacterium aestuarii]MDA5559262.1 Lrp/AsnC family transcriptional regulator [Exiguobacterium sp. MMG028]MDE0563344.1 Lrp/AsnC family transcriptional regulator [Exiguobacterium sp. B2(2022)]